MKGRVTINQCPLRASVVVVVFDVARTYQSNHVKNTETIFKFWRYWALKIQHAENLIQNEQMKIYLR